MRIIGEGKTGLHRRFTRPAFPILAIGLLLCTATLSHPARAADAPTQTCVDVRIGDQRSYDCLDQQLAREAQQSHAPAAIPSLSAASPALSVGGYNQAATHERLGTSFGHSAIPQRPPPAQFPSPLTQIR
jgi:hypothetical protein